MGISIALREWAGVVDALGSGKQTLMVRRYPPTVANFLLYPTHSYYTSSKSKPSQFDEKFQSQFRQMARDAAEDTFIDAQNLKVKFLYYCELDDAIAIEDKQTWSRLEPFFIWTANHVKSYATSSTFVWLVRVHKLAEPIEIPRRAGGGPPTFYKHSSEIDIDLAQPVLGDSEYAAIKKEILQLIQR